MSRLIPRDRARLARDGQDYIVKQYMVTHISHSGSLLLQWKQEPERLRLEAAKHTSHSFHPRMSQAFLDDWGLSPQPS